MWCVDKGSMYGVCVAESDGERVGQEGHDDSTIAKFQEEKEEKRTKGVLQTAAWATRYKKNQVIIIRKPLTNK